MKTTKTIFFLFATVIMIAVSGCKKSEDSSTKNTDPCANITCLNGGTCANGICNCPTGYTGSDCGTPRVPTSMTITGIDLTSYPTVALDLTTGPDVFLSINQGTTASDIQTSGIAWDMGGSAISYTTGFPYTISNPTVNWTIGVWDYDTPDPDDFMGGIYFVPNSFDMGFPSTITLSASSITMKLYVTWNF